MSPWVHDLTTVVLVLAGTAAILGLTPADPMVGVALLGAAGIPVVMGQRERARNREVVTVEAQARAEEAKAKTGEVRVVYAPPGPAVDPTGWTGGRPT